MKPNLFSFQESSLYKKKIIIIITLCLTITVANGDNAITAAISQTANSNPGQHVYYYHGETLSTALSLYTRSSGLKIVLADDLPDRVRNKNVSGRFVVTAPEQMIQALSSKYGFEWFIYSGTLYITPSQRISKSIEVSPEDMPMVRSNLQQIGLLNDKFGYSELKSENKIIISGPLLYVNMLLDQIRDLNISPASQQFAVYRLKYANATDTTLSFNNQQITIPGIATILQSLLQGNANSSPAGKNKLLNQITEPIKNQAQQLLSQRDNTPGTDDGNSTSNAAGSLTTPLIQADSRLNTIIIRDKTYNLKIYKNLIDLLDVPAPLIQVEVMIIHIDQKNLSQAGIDWWASGKNVGGGYGAGNLSQNYGPSNSLSFFYGQINPGQLIVTDMFSFMSSLKFLEQKHLAQAVGKPSLATTDNLPAIVNVAENLYFNNQQSANNNNNNNTVAGTTAQIVQALQITPHVIHDDQTNQNQIKLSIVLQDGAINDQNNTTLPNTTQSTINSQAVVNEGQSILLAGYTRDVMEEEVSKVPFLGDIPLLGWFFKSKTHSIHQIATLYLVTPQIVWQNKMYKLKDYVVVDNNKMDIRDNYQIVPNAAQTTKNNLNATKPNQNNQSLTKETGTGKSSLKPTTAPATVNKSVNSNSAVNVNKEDKPRVESNTVLYKVLE